MDLSPEAVARIVLSLALVIGAVVALARLARRTGRGVDGGTEWIRVLGTHVLTPGTELHLVQILDGTYVLSSGGGQVRLVARLDGDGRSPWPATSPEPAPADRLALDRAEGHFARLDRLRQGGGLA